MKSEYVKSEVDNLKSTLVNYLLITIAILGLPSLVASFISLKKADVFPVYSIVGYELILIMLILHKKIPFKVKTIVILVIGYILGTKALVNQGLISDGLFYYIIVGVISSLLLGTAYGVVLMLLSLATASLVAYFFHTGLLNYSFDTSVYINSVSTWVSHIMIILLFTSLLILISGKINNFLLGIIKNLSLRTSKLDTANRKLADEIENRKSFEISLKNSAKTFKNIFNSINDVILIFDDDLNIIEANKTFFEYTGYKNEQLKLLKISDMFDNYEDIRNNLFEHENDYFSFYRNEIKLKTMTEGSIPVESTTIPFPDQKSGTRLVILRDIRAGKESERHILNAIIQAEEKERTRVSQDLHDSLGPLLSAIKLYSNSIVGADNAPKRSEIYAKISELMDEAVKTVKEISNNMSSHVLKTFGLYEAIDSFAEKIEASYPIKIITEFDHNIKTSEDLQITLYRVLVELINNTLKYAYASEIKIRMLWVNSKLLFTYHDNGQGFEVEQVLKEGKGMGLYNMHSRIKSLGGTISIKSRPKEGMQVEIQI